MIKASILLLIIVCGVCTRELITANRRNSYPAFNGHTRFNIRNSCTKQIVAFLDKFKPPCDKDALKVPLGQCMGGDAQFNNGWNDSRNGNVPRFKFIKPGEIWTIPVPIGKTGEPEWCFDEGKSRICSGNGGWIGVD